MGRDGGGKTVTETHRRLTPLTPATGSQTLGFGLGPHHWLSWASQLLMTDGGTHLLQSCGQSLITHLSTFISLYIPLAVFLLRTLTNTTSTYSWQKLCWMLRVIPRDLHRCHPLKFSFPFPVLLRPGACSCLCFLRLHLLCSPLRSSFRPYHDRKTSHAKVMAHLSASCRR